MASLQARYDPGRTLEPELWARMVAGGKYWLRPRCQLDRSCYCEVRRTAGRGGGRAPPKGCAACARPAAAPAHSRPLTPAHARSRTALPARRARPQADEHCAQGFKCAPSRAFPEYRTCQPQAMN